MTLKPTWTEESAPVRMRRVCSWCGSVLDAGDPGAPTSHGICGPCALEMERQEAKAPALTSAQLERLHAAVYRRNAEIQMERERGDHEACEVEARVELRQRIAVDRAPDMGIYRVEFIPDEVP